MNKKTIFIIIAIVLLIISVYQGFFKKEESIFILTNVIRGNVIQEISETGQIKQGETINLSFKNSGKIEKIYVTVGQNINQGDSLAKIDASQLELQLKEAKAALNLAQVKLNKLLAGASPQEIKVSETAVSNAEIAFQDSQKNLKDVENLAAENLKSVYQDSLNILDDVYLKADNAFLTVDSIKKNYFNKKDEQGLLIENNYNKIKEALSEIKFILDNVKKEQTQENIESILLEIENNLNKIINSLRIVRDICQESAYSNIVSLTDSAFLGVNTALMNVTNSLQSIRLTKLTNESNINIAKSKVSAAEGALAAAKNQLALLTASPRQEDIDLANAQIEQAQAQIQILENQIANCIITSPTDGKIIKINKKEGELATMAEPIITLISNNSFRVEVDIPEVDIGKVNLGNTCKITLDAFEKEEFSGQVIEIEPAETLIAGVIYYKAKISFSELREFEQKIKPGMTANVTIIIDSRENVLTIPQRAVLEKDGKKIVRVPINNSAFKEVEVITGLKGSDGEIEIISGLNEGDKVIISIKEK